MTKFFVNWKNSKYESNPKTGTYYINYRNKASAKKQRAKLKKMFPNADWFIDTDSAYD